MKEMIVCSICILAMLAFVLPATVADSGPNATNDVIDNATNASSLSNETQNVSMNATKNASLNTTLHVPLNVTENIAQNVTENVSENATQTVNPEAAETVTSAEPMPSALENATPAMVPESMENQTPPAAPAATGNIAATAVGDTENNTKVLRAGFEKTKPLNNLDVYGNKSVHELGGGAEAPESAFNASQRLGNVSKFSYNTSYTKPLYNVSEYSRTKPTYQVPGGLSSKPVYDIEKYSVIKAPNGIP